MSAALFSGQSKLAAEYVAVSQIAPKLNIAASRHLPLYITAVSQNSPMNMWRKVMKKKKAEKSLRY